MTTENLRASIRGQGLLGVALAAGAGPAEEASLCAPGLAGVEIPDGFDFATTHAVALEITSGRSNPVALEISNELGHVVFRGPLSSSQTLRRNLALPTAAKTVTVALVDGVHRESAELPIQDSSASHRF